MPTKSDNALQAFTIPQIITFAISIGVSISTSLISSWLYDKFKGRVSKMSIDGKEIRLSIPEIQQAIEEYIDHRDGA